MIQKINLQKFGVFESFAWPEDLPCFKKFNLIYGWNYSGKTTLSRAFQCFELKQSHEDFPNSSIQLIDTESQTHELNKLDIAPKIRVFNSDYIRANIFFEESHAKALLVLGSKNIQKQQELKQREKELEDAKNINHQATTEKQKIEQEIRAKLTQQASKIRTGLNVLSYDVRNFQKAVNRIADKTYKKNILPPDILKNNAIIYKSEEKKDLLKNLTSELESVSQIQERVNQLLLKSVSPKTSIERLENEPNIQKWVNIGRNFHADRDQCLFCNQSLPTDLIEQLEGFFTQDYEQLQEDIQSLKKTITTTQNETLDLPSKTMFYHEFRVRRNQIQLDLNNAIKEKSKVLKRLLDVLQNKETNTHRQLDLISVDDPQEKIDHQIKEANCLIDDHNKRTNAFENKKKEAFASLESHYAASFVQDMQYFDKQTQINGLVQEIGNMDNRIKKLNSQINTLNHKISEEHKGAETINNLLAQAFGKQDIQIKVVEQQQFQIHRHGHIAKNLSEGEKTAIAFSYFITSLQDGNHDLEETIVFIDDPISSLDTNHLFNTYAIIKTQLQNCKQIFISTHSFDFYNLIRDWAKDIDKKKWEKPQSQWRYWGIYLIKRIANETTLEEVPHLLLKFKSEYHYLFSLLYKYQDKDSDNSINAEELLNLPNITRRFMEAFGGIMIPTATGLKNKMERIFPDATQKERVWKFINQYSHNTGIISAIEHRDSSECIKIVNGCLQAIKDWNQDYFEDLVKEMSSNP